MLAALTLIFACSADSIRDTSAHDSTYNSTYTTQALEQLMTESATENERVPASLQSYRAHAESELTFLLHRADGSESPVQIEQVASSVRWRRNGAFTQRVIGYRARLAGPNLSALSLIHQAWTVPVLYGNRLQLFAGRDSTSNTRSRDPQHTRRDTTIAVIHPLAADRERVYRFAGGDTVLTIRTPERAIPVAIVHVTVRPDITRRTAVFIGDLYLDAERHQIVRMRGRFDLVGGHRSFGERLQSTLVQGVAFVDLENAEIDGRYWLPAAQRIEGEIASPFTGDTRSGVRVITHFNDYTVNDTTVTDTTVANNTGITNTGTDSTAARTDSMRLLPHHLTFAPADSVSAFPHWDLPLGDATSSVNSNDFNSWLPDVWRTSGAPRLDITTANLSDLVHFDRVEGVYTGIGASLRFRDAAPGFTLRGNAGYAWTEQTVRGSIDANWVHHAWTWDLIGARALDNTNDFTTAFTSGPGFAALLVQDDYDYVDRRRVTLSALRHWGADPGASPFFTGFTIGVAQDDGEHTRVTRGLFTPSVLLNDSLFRPNRNVAQGSYVREALSIGYNPGVDAGFVRAGIGARLHYEVAEGQLSWERVETRLVANEIVGPLLLGARLDAGLVAGTRIPPQQLFEVGYDEGLFAYNYKQFAGDHAAVLQEQAVYTLPIFRTPLRLFGFILPSLAPAFALGAQHGWTEASTYAARLSLEQLGDRVNPATNAMLINPMTEQPYPVSIPTGGVRTSVDLTLRLFGNSIAGGVTQALEPGAHVQLILRLGSTL